MATAPTIETFWQQLAESKLLSAEQMAALRADRIDAGLASDADFAKRLVNRKLLSQYQADRLLEGRARGFYFDHYKIVDILGVGGMGWVYQAEDTTTGTIVALKVLQDQLKHDAGLLARFLQEGRVGLKLHHRNIIETYRLGSAGGLPYMVMEFVRGPSLLEILQRVGPIKWTQACEFARQAALGLEYAHQHGVIHRDIKPQNLLVDELGQIKLLDFGLSMVKEGEAGEEFSMAMIFGHESVGTSEFSSPEQTADSLAADARSDVYSLGGTLFTMLTASTPFLGKTVADMLKAHRTEPVRSVTRLVKGIPAGVEEIVFKMLAKRPEDRFPTAAAAAAALAEFAKAGPVSINFDVILAGRRQQAQQRLAALSKARSTPSGLRGSTARPTTVSSATGGSAAQRARSGARLAPVSEAPAEESQPVPADTGPQHRRAAQPIESPATIVSLVTGVRTALRQDQYVIGRHADCDLPISDPSISGRHAQLRYDGYHWWITDLKSRNGTRINGVPISQQILADGDVVLLGTQWKFRFDATGVERGHQQPRSGRWLAIVLGVVLFAIVTAVLINLW